LEGYYFFKAEMRRTLENLAADATARARYLKGLGISGLADELALEFDDISSRVGRAVDEDLLSSDTASAIQTLNDMLQAMSGEANARLWSIAGLQSAEWDVVRRHARAALDLYDADLSARARRAGQAVDLPSARDLHPMASAVNSKASFLDAAAAWGSATAAITGEPVLPDTPSWRSFALFLLAGKHYE
jgi:hypothetical protein